MSNVTTEESEEGDKTRAALPNPKQRKLILTFVTMKGGLKNCLRDAGILQQTKTICCVKERQPGTWHGVASGAAFV